MKKILALLLAAMLCLSLLAACGSTKPEPTEPEAPKVEDDGIMKILMIGHSLGNDSTFMVPDIFKAESDTPLVMGVLYHSGCRLGSHVQFLTDNDDRYAYYEYDTATDTQWRRADASGNYHAYTADMSNDTEIENGTIAQTMLYGISRHDWDLVVLQAGVFEAGNAKDSSLNLNIAGDLNTIINYVLQNDIQPGSVPQFAWNMTWACPSDDMLVGSYPNNLYQNFTDRIGMYEGISSTVQNIVAPAYDFAYIFPSGTAIENAISGKLEPRDIYRDFIHANDFGRMVVAYTWYCSLTGTDINDCKIGPMNHKVLLNNLSRNTGVDMVLTEEQRAILVEAVGNAMKNPYAITPSVVSA